MARVKKETIAALRKKREQLWKRFCKVPKKGSFSGLEISRELEEIQQKLDKLEGNRKSKRYYPRIRIDIG